MENIEIANEEDLNVLNDIEEKIIKDIDLGYDPQVLGILDDENASSNLIESFQNKITADIAARLFNMSNAVYFGKLFGGKVKTFYDAIMRLGMQPAKIYIIALSIFSLSNNREFKKMSARSFSTSVLGKIIADEMGLHDKIIQRIESGGLFLNMGRIITLLYQVNCSAALDEKFILKYNPYLGLKIVEKFKLPEFLKEILLSSFIRFTDDSFHYSSVVRLADSIAEKSFKEHGKLVIQSVMPDPGGKIPSTPGSIIADRFRAIGFSEFLEVVAESLNVFKLHVAQIYPAVYHAPDTHSFHLCIF